MLELVPVEVIGEATPDDGVVGDSGLIQDMPAGIRGPEEFAGFVRMMHAAFPDFRLETHEIIVDGATAARFCTMHGTHQGELRGIAPSGCTVARPRIDTFRIENGKIREVQGYLDHQALFASLQPEAEAVEAVR